ncbi:bifunctional folylpolyglutamate synthase/dihydrofolate synthase [Pararhizobium mangrovi]|uniref:Dihydrofolate synthase/folylpolyglutamate synthase n=1 Tax=Pararhizobium mangrovi TaxID=2590452 RepID=A0A506U5D7_9HYPH|nr:folylpolyglutamate synthase/dihydrofolate synthase family protein [Pararhizobium mangrovi]TPW28391.1 bifunctional folylpolyglutamate synthase/dihydrofolate synthase [Pararhizobium mangrovi]
MESGYPATGSDGDRADAASREIDALLARIPKGIDLSLDRIERLLHDLGDPQEKLPPVIHIAGTNGKGSASAFCRAMLEAAGYAVHVHTSPHLVRWHERFRIARQGAPGRFVEDATLLEAVRRAVKVNAGQTITIFELLTAVTFLLFAEHPADVAIVEVGLGGRFDATNVLAEPAVALIMPVSLDHQAYLGDRVELIAAEKAGIIKSGRPVVIARQEEDAALDVLTATAARLRAPASVYGQDFFAYEEHGRLVYQDETGLADLPMPRLAGRYQHANAAAAIRALKAAGFDLPAGALEKGLSTVVWPGRMQRLTEGRLVALAPPEAEIWLDGGHNPGAAAVAAAAMGEREERTARPLHLISGMLDTKDAPGYFAAFAGMARHVVTVRIPDNENAVDPVALATDAAEAGLSAEPRDTLDEAFAAIREASAGGPPPRILICGSLYLAGHVLAENGTPPT